MKQPKRIHHKIMPLELVKNSLAATKIKRPKKVHKWNSYYYKGNTGLISSATVI